MELKLKAENVIKLWELCQSILWSGFSLFTFKSTLWSGSVYSLTEVRNDQDQFIRIKRYFMIMVSLFTFRGILWSGTGSVCMHLEVCYDQDQSIHVQRYVMIRINSCSEVSCDQDQSIHVQRYVMTKISLFMFRGMFWPRSVFSCLKVCYDQD